MAFFEGNEMTGGYGNGPDIINSCTVNVNKGEIVSILGPKRWRSLRVAVTIAPQPDECLRRVREAGRVYLLQRNGHLHVEVFALRLVEQKRRHRRYLAIPDIWCS